MTFLDVDINRAREQADGDATERGNHGGPRGSIVWLTAFAQRGERDLSTV